MFGLTIPQQNIWNLQKYYAGTSISNNCGAIFFGKLCDHDILNQSINKLIELQEGMRLQFREKNGVPMQYAVDYAPQTFPSRCFSTREEFDAFARDYAQVPFDLIDTPMYRFVIFDSAEQSGVLVCTSHLITDGWSIGIGVRTIYSYYNTLESKVELDIPSGCYTSFIESEQRYLASDRYQKDRTYWSSQWDAPPAVSSMRPGSSETRSAFANRYSCALSPSLSASIDEFYREYNVSQAVLFEAAVLLYLSQLNPTQKQHTLGVPVLNRSGAAEKRAVGMFISTTALTVPIEQDMTGLTLCKEISRQHFQLFRHQKYPYSHILHDLHERFGFSGNLYDVIVSFQNARSNTDAQTKWYSNGFCEVGLELHIDNRDSSDCYTINIDYQTELFKNEEELDLLFRRLVHILTQVIRTPEIRLDEVTILPKEEHQLTLEYFNQTAVPYDKSQCVHTLFTEQAAKAPDSIALIFEGREFTYRQLDEMSNSLAHFLREKGVVSGSIVPIISRRSWHVIVAMLGVLKAGGAYMPVDPSYPGDRIRSMLDIAHCQLALTCAYAESLDIETVSLEGFDFCVDISPVENRNSSEDLCYIIFTSGSTGTPKGVSICHRNVVNYCNYNAFNVCGSIVTESERIVSVTNTIFDIFVTESLLPLLNGVTIYLANEEQAVSQKRLSELIDHSPIDVIQTTPTKMRSFIMDKQNLGYLRKLKRIALGGEALPSDLHEELRRHTDAQIFNIYGPAETTVWSTNKCVTDPAITIGKPIANTQIYILDQNQQLLPIGVAGELCISGDGVGKGYLNRPDLTAERFLPDPFRPGQTMYRTGDLARWRMDGEIEYLGRIDTQVKIRGLRIELGEIESVMSSFDGIGLTAVTDKRDENGRQYLVGYYTAEAPVDETALRRHLTAKLPQYMVPNFLMHLPSMPMTPSGKTDRKNLPTPELTPQQREYVAPETASETILCGILSELLSAERIGVTDDFFELGGDSLCAIEYVAQAHNQGIEIALQNVFDYPTVRGLCEYLGGTYIRKAVYDPADFVKYEPLLKCNSIDESFVPVRRSLGNVFLTGATGFLGAHILDQYLREESGTIYCLVRGGAERLKGILNYYFDGKYNSEMDRRIIALEGDITEAGLCDRLTDDIQTVIHAAATVKHYGPWDYFHGVNVRGTENIIVCAKKLNAKLLHISTISVSGNSLVDAFDVLRVEEAMDFTESDLFVGQPLDNVYIRSKFEAERAVLDATLDGLDAKIIRVGNLTNRLTDFRFQPNYHSNAFLNRVRAALSLGALPDYMVPLYAEFSPIDQTAEGVLKIGQYADRQTVFHLNSHRNLYFDRMVELLNQLEMPMQILPGEAFNAMLQQMGRNPETAFIYEALQNDMDDTGKLVYDSNIHIRNEFTVWFLEKLGFRWAEIDLDYVSGYLNYFRTLGYFS